MFIKLGICILFLGINNILNILIIFSSGLESSESNDNPEYVLVNFSNFSFI